jgi:threonine aldolase
MRFLSDNAAAVCPEVMEAVVQANVATDKAYDADPWSARLDALFSDFFGTRCRAYAVSTGTAANSLALAALVPPFGAVVCHREAHIEVDECGAPEFFTGGAKLLLCEGDHAKLTPETIAAGTAAMRGDVHQVQIRALSITNATEYGTVYTPDEVSTLAGIAKDRGWRVHMDGARFANALVHLGCHPGDVTWRAGVDVLSFGAIKNGGLSAEALVFFDEGLAAELPYRRKRAGQMPSKGRFQAAQLIAYLESGAWRRNAEAANAGARRLAEAAGDRLTHPVEANEVFVDIGANGDALRARGFNFYDWGAAGSGEARFVVSWDQREDEIAALAEALRNLA